MTGHATRKDLARAFLWLGTTVLGGPAVHIARMEETFVRRRAWLSPERFGDLLGTANLIPGPTSTELALFIGYECGGYPGLLIAGACFILPASVLVGVLAWAYTLYGGLPVTRGVLDGVQPVVLAVVVQAIWTLARATVKTPVHGALALTVAALALRGQPPLTLMLTAGAVATVAGTPGRRRDVHGVLPMGMVAQGVAVVHATADLRGPGGLFLAMVKIGATLYGSGYVLLSLLRHEVVVGAHRVTDRQLLDAVAVGQVTPGPVFTTATFLGYLASGPWGAVVATAGIFLPSFVYVGVLGPWLLRLRAVPWVRDALGGVNAAAVGLMASVVVTLGGSVLVHAGQWDGVALALGAGSALALVLGRVNATGLIALGALLGGWLHHGRGTVP